jgi:prepilin-type processing-associated H-X9-DG protein
MTLRRRRWRRRGFTIKELIVCIFAIGLLVSLLLPATRGGRGAARKTQCINHQHQIGLAVMGYEMDKQRYPGWAVNQNPDENGCGGREASWVFALLPYLDRTDIVSYYGRNGSNAGTQPEEHLKVMVCPDDAESVNNGTSMSYVVNTGYYHDALPYRDRPEHAAVGVFTYQYRSAPEDVRTKLASTDVTDGLATTLMLSENIDAGTWVGHDGGKRTDRVEEGCIGFAWLGSEANPKINAEVGTAVCAQPRPSSYHSGGAVVTFCDGHTQFLLESLDPRVFQLLCTPQRAIVDLEYQPTAPQRALRESEY